MKTLTTHLLLLFCLVLNAQVYDVKTVPNPISNGSFVSNPDNILSLETVNQLNGQLSELKRTNSSEISIVVLNSIGDNDIKSFATELFNYWGIGTKSNDNGLLLLFVLDQRKVTFEVGYGLEGALPDAICKRIQTKDMIPSFKSGDYNTGFLNATNSIISRVKGETFVEPKVVIPWTEIIPIALGIYILIMVLALVWLNGAVTRIRKNPKYSTNFMRYKALKTEKASILLLIAIGIPIVLLLAMILFKAPSYLMLLLLPVPLATLPAHVYGRFKMRTIRREPVPCGECGSMMHLLSEKQEDAYLKLSQQFEEQLHAVDYDVFVCDSCKNETIYTYDKPSAYTNCPKCNTKAFILKSKKTIIAPTHLSSGTERVTYHCKFCGYEENHNNNLPRLQNNNDGAFVKGVVIGSILNSGRGGFGGGGGFSGGSFGGGSSGGGGATSGW